MSDREGRLASFLDRYLEPADRLNEVLFGLIMVLTFTLTAGFAVGEGPGAAREQVFRGIREAARRAPPERMRLLREDLQGGLASFCLVVLSTIPAALPFLLIDQAHLALRVSNFLMVGLLFAVGFRWGAFAYANRWVAGLAFLGVGLALVGAAIALGG